MCLNFYDLNLSSDNQSIVGCIQLSIMINDNNNLIKISCFSMSNSIRPISYYEKNIISIRNSSLVQYLNKSHNQSHNISNVNYPIKITSINY